MKKFWQISLIVVLTVALVFMAFTFKAHGSSMAAGTVHPQVGWHTGATDSGSPLAYVVPLPGMVTTNVGWRG